MQRAHDQVATPADIAKTILLELQGFNPFSTLKYSFWYFIGIALLMICCFCLLSVRTRKTKRWLLRLDIEIHRELLRNRVGEMLGTRHDPGLGYNGVCTASPCRSLHSLFYHNFPSTWCLDLCSHISLKNTTCCVRTPAPWCKTR
jgi:hypothetical protein